MLETTRLVFMPIVNPGGMLRHTRANPAGVDLMRNAPVDAPERVPLLVGGQRISAGLPWYRGREGAPMQPESAALCAVVERELHGRAFSLALDSHSGFGMRDRVWFPYAHRVSPIPHLAQLHALHQIFAHSNVHHRYVFEPQSRQYLTHGDLWDHLYLVGACALGSGVFLPLTLEMGSWLWVKKNPRQLFSRHGIFNPLIAHRQQRVLRGHLPLLDFAVRAAASWKAWLPEGVERDQHPRRHRPLVRERAMMTWVLLRGLAREARHWGDFGNALALRLGHGQRVLAIDLPGNGVRHEEVSPLSVAAITAAARADLAQRGVPPPYGLVALSLGGMVALQWCAAAPQELAGCVLINSSQRGISPFWQRLQPRSYAALAGLLQPGLSSLARETRVLSLTSSAPACHPAEPARWAAIARQFPVAPCDALRQLVAAARYRPPAQRPVVPLLLLASAGDRLVSPRCSQALAARWELPLRLHPDAGHDLPLDEPEWVLEQIARWRKTCRLL